MCIFFIGLRELCKKWPVPSPVQEPVRVGVG